MSQALRDVDFLFLILLSAVGWVSSATTIVAMVVNFTGARPEVAVTAVPNPPGDHFVMPRLVTGTVRDVGVVSVRVLRGGPVAGVGGHCGSLEVESEEFGWRVIMSRR